MDVDEPSYSKQFNLQPGADPTPWFEWQEARASPELKPLWANIRTSHTRKLWHNLTEAIVNFVFNPSSGPYQIELYNFFVEPIESKINALRLVEIARRVGREYSEPELTLQFLQKLHSRLASPYPPPSTENENEVPPDPPSRPIPEAYALSLSSIAYAQLLLGDLPACKKSLDECEKILEEQDTVEPVVNSGYYGVAGDYFKVKADYGPYYKNALLYLACVDVDKELNEEERKARAHDLCIAALLGDNIYNFGELLQHPILQSLNGTESAWIKDLISAFNNGSIGRFESMANNFASEPILETSMTFLRQKICLMALIQTAFARPRDGSSRLMTFQSIAEATRLPVNEVEHLIMKALSLQLIRGTLDQIDSTADITWVTPRVLEDNQLKTLSDQFNMWRDGVGVTAQEVESQRVAAKTAVQAA